MKGLLSRVFQVITLVALSFLFLSVSLSVTSSPLHAQSEYYFPQQQKPIEPGGRSEGGIRTRFRTTGGNQRTLELIPSFTYSPESIPRLQLNTELPIAYVNQNSGDPLFDRSETDIGDLLVSLRYPLMGEANWQLIGSLESSFPTGKNSFENPVGTGDGFERYTPGVTFLYLKDPISSFFHVGYEYSREETFNVPSQIADDPNTLRDLLRIILLGTSSPTLDQGKNKIDPGDAIRLRGGMSVLFNPTMRFNLFSSLSIRGKQEIDGVEDPNSSRDDVRLGTGLDFDLSQDSTLSMNFVFGFSQSADDVTWVTGYTETF